jgi:hypothetical protein
MIELQYSTEALAPARYVDIDPAAIESVGDRCNGDGAIIGANVRTRSGLTHEVIDKRRDITQAMQARVSAPQGDRLGFAR